MWSGKIPGNDGMMVEMIAVRETTLWKIIYYKIRALMEEFPA